MVNLNLRWALMFESTFSYVMAHLFIYLID